MSRSILEYPVTYGETCQHLRVDFGEDDLIINRLIKAATSLAENYIEKDLALSERTIVATLKNSLFTFKATNLKTIDEVLVDGEIAFYDIGISDDQYTIKLIDISSGEITVKYTTGYSIEEIDESIRTAILIKIGELYDVDRQGYTPNNYKATGQFERILNHYKLIYFR